MLLQQWGRRALLPAIIIGVPSVIWGNRALGIVFLVIALGAVIAGFLIPPRR